MPTKYVKLTFNNNPKVYEGGKLPFIFMPTLSPDELAYWNKIQREHENLMMYGKRRGRINFGTD